MKDIYDILREVKRRSDETFALATLVRAQGSSYRRPGARMLICEDGLTIGSLSGGCLEEEVALRAREVLQTGESMMMSFDTRKRFGCHGKIDIFIERVSEKYLSDIAADLDARHTHLAVTTFDECEFIQEIHPPIRLLLFGDGPDTGSLVSLGRLLRWEAGCDPVAVVVGSDKEKIVAELRDSGAMIVENEHWRTGIGSSIRAGVKHLIDNEPLAAIVLLVCDQPFVDAELIKQLLAHRAMSRKAIAASRYGDTVGVPALFDRSCFSELLAIDDEAGAKKIILQNRERVTEFSFPPGKIDIDTWSDYERLTNEM